MTDFQAERENMIESQVRPNAVTNTALIKAMAQTPREMFVPPSQKSFAYMDAALRVETARDGQIARYLLSPMIFAKLAQLARVKQADRVLDIGPATGYSSAILAKLAKEVIAVERDAGLAAIATDAMQDAQIENVKVVISNHEIGVPESAPFDVIFMNGRLGCEPNMLFEQLSSNGRLVAVIVSETAAIATLFTKLDSTIQEEIAFDAGAPLLPGFEPQSAFTF